MKNTLLLFCFFISLPQILISQTRFIENFDYPAGDSVIAHGWTPNSGGSLNRITVTSPGLNYADYPLSGTGNAATLTTTGQDAFKKFSDSITSQSVYGSFLVNVTAAVRPGDYFAAFLPTNSSTFYSGRVHARFKDGFLEFGLTKASPNDTNLMVWASGFMLNTTYLMVLKYTFAAGAANDMVSLYIFPLGVPLTEPLPVIGPVSYSGTSSDAANIGRFALRQGITGRAPDLIIDGILVTSSWFTVADFYQNDIDLGKGTEINSDWGTLKIKHSGFNRMKYVNLSVSTPGTTTIWQIENMPLWTIGNAGVVQSMSYYFDIGDKGIDVATLNYGLEITDDPLMLPPPITSSAVVSDQFSKIYNGMGDIGRIYGAADVQAAGPNVGKASDVPAIDTTKHLLKDPMPNQESKLYECVPTAVSNSLKYLKKHFELEFDSNYTSIDSAKKMVKFGENFPNGTSLLHWAEYKAAYMESKSIPITTRRIDSADVSGRIASLIQEIDDGQDIELNIEVIIDDTTYGHAVNLVGIQRLGNGRYNFIIQNDIAQDAAGGVEQETLVYDTTSNKFTSGKFIEYTISAISIECPSPPDPALVAPDNGSPAVPLDPELDWDEATGAILYRTQVSLNPAFTAVVFDLNNIPGTSIQILPGILLPGNTYFWRVRGYDSAGPGPWSDVWSFTTASSILNLTSFIQGFYNSATDLMIQDTVKVYLRNNVFPFALVDSAKGILNPSGSGIFAFSNAENEAPYYLVVKHRNSIETWSAVSQIFTSNSLSYDFTASSSQAYGNNLRQIDNSPIRYGILSGDVNQDGFVNLDDVIFTFNNAVTFTNGYVVTDVNGDNLTDLDDLIMVYNNAAQFVQKITP